MRAAEVLLFAASALWPWLPGWVVDALPQRPPYREQPIACRADRVTDDGAPAVWHITQRGTDGRAYVLVQTTDSLNRALAACKDWLESQSKSARARSRFSK